MARIKKEKSPESILKSFVINTLRRSSYRWPARSQALKLARLERGIYQCNSCNGRFTNKEIKVDHVLPIVEVKNGFTTWDSYINNLFCDVSGLQILCSTCHNSKSSIEKDLRVKYRKLRKASK